MLKPTTRQLIESFRYRRLAYLPRDGELIGDVITVRQNEAIWHHLDRKREGREYHRRRQIEHLDYRKHLATLHSTNGG